MNSLDAAQQIANISPKTRVVLFTAHDSGVLRVHASRAGINAVVAKDGVIGAFSDLKS
jgi:DNA-binding NarL/FixJ family response regulator